MKIRTLLSFLALLSIFLSLWLAFSHMPSAESKISHLFKEGKWSACEELVKSLPTKSLKLPKGIYLSFIAQARGQFYESKEILERLVKSPKNEIREVQIPLSLSKCLNSVKLRKLDELDNALEQARVWEAPLTFTNFFEGFRYYFSGNYSQALALWEKKPAYLSGETTDCCFSSILKQSFCEQELSLYFAHALIEIENHSEAHQILEKNCFSQTNSHNSTLQQRATLLLGLNNLKEGIHLPLDEQDSCFKLADFYFSRCRFSEKNKEFYDTAVDHIVSACESIFENQTGTYLKGKSIPLLNTLHNWGYKKTLLKLSPFISNSLLRKPLSIQYEFINSVLDDVQSSTLEKALCSAFLDSFSQNLAPLNQETVIRCWKALTQLDPSPKQARHLYERCSEKLPALITLQDPQLLELKKFIALWNSLSIDEFDKKLFSDLLLRESQRCWMLEGLEKQGEGLMRLSLEQSPSREVTKNIIEHFLLSLYAQAEKNNMLNRLACVQDALETFDVPIQEEVTQEKIANHLADAHYLFSTKNWMGAQTHARWVLRLDSNNIKAKRLIGLSAFHLGDHALAFSLLKDIPNPDKSVSYALALSQGFSKAQPNDHLVQTDGSEHLFEEEEPYSQRD